MSLLAILVVVVVFCLLWWAIGLIPVGPPFLKNVLYIVLIVVAVVWLLWLVGYGPGLALK